MNYEYVTMKITTRSHRGCIRQLIFRNKATVSQYPEQHRSWCKDQICCNIVYIELITDNVSSQF